MLSSELLVSELAAVDRLAASAVADSEVTALQHELLDDTVELRALISELDALLSNTLLASAESAEVLSGLGDEVVVKAGLLV